MKIDNNNNNKRYKKPGGGWKEQRKEQSGTASWKPSPHPASHQPPLESFFLLHQRKRMVTPGFEPGNYHSQIINLGGCPLHYMTFIGNWYRRQYLWRSQLGCEGFRYTLLEFGYFQWRVDCVQSRDGMKGGNKSLKAAVRDKMKSSPRLNNLNTCKRYFLHCFLLSLVTTKCHTILYKSLPN